MMHRGFTLLSETRSNFILQVFEIKIRLSPAGGFGLFQAYQASTTAITRSPGNALKYAGMTLLLSQRVRRVDTVGKVSPKLSGCGKSIKSPWPTPTSPRRLLVVGTIAAPDASPWCLLEIYLTHDILLETSNPTCVGKV